MAPQWYWHMTFKQRLVLAVVRNPQRMQLMKGICAPLVASGVVKTQWRQNLCPQLHSHGAASRAAEPGGPRAIQTAVVSSEAMHVSHDGQLCLQTGLIYLGTASVSFVMYFLSVFLQRQQTIQLPVLLASSSAGWAEEEGFIVGTSKRAQDQIELNEVFGLSGSSWYHFGNENLYLYRSTRCGLSLKQAAYNALCSVIAGVNKDQGQEKYN